MKRFVSVLILVSMVLSVLPAMAENVFYGHMEVVNCKEWVSLREEPRTGARRLAKVPLGAVVTQCQSYGTGWVYAQYEDLDGYIQDQYVQVLEGLDVYSAMMVTNCETGTDYYETIGALSADGFIPADTILRNCAVMASGRAYVEYCGRSVYVDADSVVPYSQLSHYPLQMTLHYNDHIFEEGYEAPALDLQIAYTEDFDLSASDYTEYDYTEFEPVDEEIPKVKFVLYTDKTIKNVHLFSVSLRCINDETGEEVLDTTLENIQYQMDPGQPLSVTAVMYGDMPNLAVGYEDETGVYHFAFVDISGEDGSIYLSEF